MVNAWRERSRQTWLEPLSELQILELSVFTEKRCRNQCVCRFAMLGLRNHSLCICRNLVDQTLWTGGILTTGKLTLVWVLCRSSWTWQISQVFYKHKIQFVKWRTFHPLYQCTHWCLFSCLNHLVSQFSKRHDDGVILGSDQSSNCLNPLIAKR